MHAFCPIRGNPLCSVYFFRLRIIPQFCDFGFLTNQISETDLHKGYLSMVLSFIFSTIWHIFLLNFNDDNKGK